MGKWQCRDKMNIISLSTIQVISDIGEEKSKQTNKQQQKHHSILAANGVSQMETKTRGLYHQL